MRFKKLSQRKGIPNKSSLTAHSDMDRLGINPIEMLLEVFKESMNAYRSGRGYGDKSDAGPYYLSCAGKAASDLARFKHPTMSAIAVADLSKGEGSGKIATAAEAMQAIINDPFAPKEIKEVNAEKVIEAMKSTIQAPELPIGKPNDRKD